MHIKVIIEVYLDIIVKGIEKVGNRMEFKLFSLEEFCDVLKDAGLVTEYDYYGMGQTKVENTTYNSKETTAGTMFVCKGVTFKSEYLMDSLNRGAFAYVSEVKYDTKGNVPYIIVSDVRKAMPIIADMFYNQPENKIKLTAITGTKGKSTACYYVKAILDDYLLASGKMDCGITSTIDTYDGIEKIESHNTTPEAMELYRHLSNAVKSEMEHMIIEASAQAFKYNRVDGIVFDAGVFLNISEDHISPIEHPDFEDYFESKLMMYNQTRTAVVNLDADYSDRILKAASKCPKVITFSLEDENASVYGYDVQKGKSEIAFRVRCDRFDEEIKITMPGLFNVENALAAICVANEYNIPLEYIKSGLYRARSKGRMEVYTSKDENVVVIVDYAHNKLSFEKLFASTRKEYPGYEITVVFGCPGKKALLRRRDLGIGAGMYADKVYIVPEDPATEDPYAIAEEVASYVKPYNKPYKIFPDRGSGVKAAVEDATGKSVILVTGKGCETRQFINGVYVDCPSDADFAIKYIDEYNMKNR